MQVTLTSLPATLAEFQTLSLNTPEEVVAGFLCALHLYVKDPSDGVEAMNILRGPRPMTPMTASSSVTACGARSIWPPRTSTARHLRTAILPPHPMC